MHVPVANTSQSRAPTLQGTFSHTPDDVLERIADKHNVSVSSLATLTVLHNTGSLYNAILEYAALCDPPAKDTFHPLFVDSFEDRRDDSDAENEDSADEGDSRFSRPRDDTILQSGQGLRRRHVPEPKFKLALGQTSVIWPPPPHLTAEALVKLRDSKKKSKKPARGEKKRDQVANDVAANATDHNEPSEKDSNAPVVTKFRTSHVIHVIHYSVGEPKAVEMGGILTSRELRMVSTESAAMLRQFAVEVLKWRSDKDYVEGDGSKFALYRFKTDNCGGGWWQSEGMKRARPAASVILPKGQLDSVLNDVRNFIKPETKKWYIAHGLPHRRSYLFYGPPGTGKTSTIRAIGSMFRLNCCFLSMTTASFSNQVLGDALSQIPANALIVLEDVDALFNEDRKNEQSNSLTFSGLLNALDGLISADGVITIMTTNFVNRLDKALIRGGRVDRRFLFAKPTQEQLKDLFLSFYPSATPDILHEFVDAVFSRKEGEEARSIATLQQLFIDQRESSAQDCVSAIPDFFERHFPTGTDDLRETLYS